MAPRSIGPATLAVLGALAEGHHYGFDIIDRTGLPGGTVYPALGSLERRALARSAWEDERRAREEGRPRRRYYRITAEGQRMLEAARLRMSTLGLGSRGGRPEEAT